MVVQISVAALEAAIRDYLASHNANPETFTWTKTAQTILDKERRASNALERFKAGYQLSESAHQRDRPKKAPPRHQGDGDAEGRNGSHQEMRPNEG